MKNLLRLLLASFVVIAASATRADEKPAAPVAAAISVAGTWNLQVETGQGTGTPVFTFTQDGDKLTGSYKGAFGEAPVTGTLKGSEIKFSIKVNSQGEDLVVTYSGTVSGDTMKGTAKFGGLGEGAFTGKKQAK